MESSINLKDNEGVLVEKYTLNTVDYESYEKWLEEKELEGWNLKSVKYTTASIASKDSLIGEHVFNKGEKRKIRYCLDIKENVGEDYKKIFQDFGWTLVAKALEYWLWSMEYKGERPEAFDRIDAMKERSHKYITSLIKYILSYVGLLAFLIILYKDKIPPLFNIAYSIVLLGVRVLYRWSDFKYIGVYIRNKKIIEAYEK